MILLLLVFFLAAAIWLVGIALASWAVQFTILSLAPRRLWPLRWLVPLLPMIPLGISGWLPSYFGAFIMAPTLLGWGLAWVVHKAFYRGARSEKTEPDL